MYIILSDSIEGDTYEVYDSFDKSIKSMSLQTLCEYKSRGRLVRGLRPHGVHYYGTVENYMSQGLMRFKLSGMERYFEFNGNYMGVRAYLGGLSNVVLPDFVCAIHQTAFQGACKTEIKSLHIPDGVHLIYSMFRNFVELRKLRLPDDLREIDMSLCEGCTNLVDVNIPILVTKIHENAFRDCSSLTTVDMSDSVIETIDISAFCNCTSLKEVRLPKTLKTIDEFAFGNTAIESIVIPESVTKLDRYAFGSCKQLKDIYIEGSGKSRPQLIVNDNCNIHMEDG